MPRVLLGAGVGVGRRPVWGGWGTGFTFVFVLAVLGPHRVLGGLVGDYIMYTIAIMHCIFFLFHLAERVGALRAPFFQSIKYFKKYGVGS